MKKEKGLIPLNQEEIDEIMNTAQRPKNNNLMSGEYKLKNFQYHMDEHGYFVRNKSPIMYEGGYSESEIKSIDRFLICFHCKESWERTCKKTRDANVCADYDERYLGEWDIKMTKSLVGGK